MGTKPFYLSKTLWINLIGLAYVLFGKYVGVDFTTPENTATILVVINVFLRLITKSEVTIS